jgi:SAM-dependent methyltransferase
LDEARGAGWQARGVEVSPYAVAEACGRGLEVTLGCAEDLALGRALLDCVVLWDTIEHVRDPAGVLHRASAALRPGGVLALSTGDVTSLCARLSGPRWHLFNLPEHLYFFSPAALQRLLARVGCVVVRITREVNWLPVRYLLERVRKSPGDLGNVMRHAAALLMSSPLAHTVVPATLGDVLGVYAVKTRAGV